MERQAEISAGLLARRVGRVYDVLVDRAGEARSAFEAPEVDGVIRLAGGRPGSFVAARITRAGTHDLEADLVREKRSCA